jgi:deoxyribonuclease-4
LLQGAEAVTRLGGRRVIFHPGSPGKQRREVAMDLAEETLRRAVAALDKAGYEEIVLCPETMGKVGQLGSLQEIMLLCGVDKRITPCIDFGHLNARTQGGIKAKQDYADILNEMKNALGDARAENFHVHFSKIEYTAAGERRHLTFADDVYGPDPKPLLELCREQGLAPTFICESNGTQAEDAAAMVEYYARL